MISPPINKLPWAASGVLTVPVWIHEQRKSKRSVFFQKLFGKNYRPFVGKKGSQQMPSGNQSPGISHGGADGGVGSQGSVSAARGEPGLNVSKGKHWRELGSWGAVCTLPALAQAQLFSLTKLPWALVPHLEFQSVFKDWLLQPAPALFSNTCLQLAQESRPKAGSFSGFSVQPT